MQNIPYNRAAAVEYAEKWALSFNPAYYNFSNLGGDCTNFASQCIFAGAKIMNYTKDVGWYYNRVYDRAAAWTSVEYLYRFLVQNKGVGPYAKSVSLWEIEAGDIIQLGNENGRYYHSLVVLSQSPEILIAAHSEAALFRPLFSYDFYTARFLHIQGVRKY